MSSKMNFRISSALKTIIGKELITNKFIAIFELVKNSFDAYADRVDVIFKENKMTIKDNGKGMDLTDIKNKWLFVGYSAKTDNTENNGYKDYRKKISARKNFAGAKGIGRFACDRLGKKLRLISIKEVTRPKIEAITVYWDSFEKDIQKDFINIDVQHDTLNVNPYPDIKHGTILEITELRENWKGDINKLNRHLSKLINPIKTSKIDNFEIYVKEYDLKPQKIDNFIFDKLALKTTQIITKFHKKYISTEIIDRGEKIYKIKEINLWSELLYDIDIRLFYLNKPTKIVFHHLTGMNNVEFGSVFLYKNGFRVFPYGEKGDDSLSLDQRKTQGYARFLGTRDIVGFIEINNKSDEFKETSSRDGGLIGTNGYNKLVECFREKCLRRLEIYTIDTLDWTYNQSRETEFFPKDRNKEIQALIKKLTASENIINLEYIYKLKDKIEEKSKEGFKGATKRLHEEAKKTGDIKLKKAVQKIEKTFITQKRIIQDSKQKIEQEEKKSSALLNLTTQNFENLVSYHHQIGILADTIKEYVDLAIKNIRKNNFEKIENYLQKIKKENSKIASISRFASKSGMNIHANKRKRDLSDFIIKYLEQDYIPIASDSLDIKVKNYLNRSFYFNFRPFDISTIFDNIIDNSKKASASQVSIELSGDDKILEVIIIDDGNGLSKTFKNNPLEIFKAKTSTTEGSGWGLYHVKELLNSLNANIEVHPRKQGIKFVITFKGQ